MPHDGVLFLVADFQLPLPSEGLRDPPAACAAQSSGAVMEPRDVQGKALLRAPQPIN